MRRPITILTATATAQPSSSGVRESHRPPRSSSAPRTGPPLLRRRRITILMAVATGRRPAFFQRAMAAYQPPIWRSMVAGAVSSSVCASRVCGRQTSRRLQRLHAAAVTFCDHRLHNIDPRATGMSEANRLRGAAAPFRCPSGAQATAGARLISTRATPQWLKELKNEESIISSHGGRVCVLVPAVIVATTEQDLTDGPAVQDAIVNFGYPVHPQPAAPVTTCSIPMTSPSSREEPSHSPCTARAMGWRSIQSARTRRAPNCRGSLPGGLWSDTTRPARLQCSEQRRPCRTRLPTEATTS